MLSFNYIIFTGDALLILFAIHLLTTRQGNIFLNRLLSFIYIARAIQNILFLMLSQNQNFYSPFIFGINPVVSYLSPVICYLYIKGFLRDETKLKKGDWLHFIPAVFVLINMIPFYVSSTPEQQAFINNFSGNKITTSHIKFIIPLGIIFLSRSLIFLSYMFFSWKIFIVAIKNKADNIIPVQKKWLAFLLSISSLFHMITFFVTFYMISHDISIGAMLDLKLFSITVSVFMLMFIIYPILQPVVLFGHLIVKPPKDFPLTEATEPISIPSTEDVDSIGIPKNTLLTEEQIHYYEKLFEESMKTDKFYLDPEITISKLSELINIPKHHCSFFLNQTANKSFRTYINHYRIKYFLELHAMHSKELTNEALFIKSGFNSRNTFITAFKKETGYTPTAHFILYPNL
jgi:hypothetical protein